MGTYDAYGWKPYVPVAERRRKAARKVQQLAKKGRLVSPVVLEGRAIAATFWGKAWCDNLERYSDFANRLPRGRTYVRNGSVIDLQMGPGEVSAMVSGSDIYRVSVQVSAVSHARWTSICDDCAGAIDSLVELLQGRFSKGVMARICQQEGGLFPAPAEIKFSCSCPDWASMCKHVAAVFYGIGARLDERPELLFKLRKVDETALIAKVGQALPLSKKGPTKGRVLASEGLSELFGLEMVASADEASPQPQPQPEPPAAPAAPAAAKATRRRPSVRTKQATKAKTTKRTTQAKPRLRARDVRRKPPRR